MKTAELPAAIAATHEASGLLVRVTNDHIHAFLHYGTDPIESAIHSACTLMGCSHARITYKRGQTSDELSILIQDEKSLAVCPAPEAVLHFFKTKNSKESWEFKPFSFYLKHNQA